MFKLPHAVWSFLGRLSACSGVFVMVEILAAKVLGFVLRFCVKHWLLSMSLVDFSRMCRFEFVTTVYWSCDEKVCIWMAPGLVQSVGSAGVCPSLGAMMACDCALLTARMSKDLCGSTIDLRVSGMSYDDSRSASDCVTLTLISWSLDSCGSISIDFSF